MNNSISADAEIAKILIGLGMYYGMKLLPEQVDMYVEDLRDIDPNALKVAVIRYRNEPANIYFPRPAQLKGMLTPSDDSLGRDVAARITTALGRFGGGHNNEKAKEFIGEVGWEVVKLQGGWIELCRVTDSQSLSNAQAQWRELAKTVITKHKLGIQDEAPKLPIPDLRLKGLLPISEIFEKIPEISNVPLAVEDSKPFEGIKFSERLKNNSAQLADPQAEFKRQMDALKAAGIA